MKKFKTPIILIFVLSIVSFLISTYVYPNVVTGLKPVKKANKKAIAALNNVARAKNRDSALVVAVNHLNQHGSTLEERVAYWVDYDFQQIDSMKFKLVSGIGISATDAENNVKEGYTRDQVVVEIFSNNVKEEYFLQCANGLVSKRWPNQVAEKNIGQTRVIAHTNILSLSGDSVATIQQNASLCGTLGITVSEAKDLAHREDLKVFKKGNKTVVVVYPGDKFQKVDNVWQKIE